MTSFHLFSRSFCLYLQTKEERRIYWISQFYFTSPSVFFSSSESEQRNHFSGERKERKFNKKLCAQIKRLSETKWISYHKRYRVFPLKFLWKEKPHLCSQHQLQFNFIPFVGDLLNKFSFPTVHSSAKIDWLNGLVLVPQTLFIDSVSVQVKLEEKLDFHGNN